VTDSALGVAAPEGDAAAEDLVHEGELLGGNPMFVLEEEAADRRRGGATHELVVAHPPHLCVCRVPKMYPIGEVGIGRGQGRRVSSPQERERLTTRREDVVVRAAWGTCTQREKSRRCTDVQRANVVGRRSALSRH
jgi:hypothetical protein